MEPTPFSREELQQIEGKALVNSEILGINPQWQRAYLALADACDRLDAMIARTIVYEEKNGSV